MQRIYSLFAAFILVSFLLLIAVKINVNMTKDSTISVEQLDLEDILEDDQAEVEFQFKDFHSFHWKLPIASEKETNLRTYSFAIKLNSQEVHLPPPEA